MVGARLLRVFGLFLSLLHGLFLVAKTVVTQGGHIHFGGMFLGRAR